MPLQRPFYQRSSTVVARELLGKNLVYESPLGRISGRIVETEAYHESDPASHAYGGKNARNAVMFGEAGHAYVYFIYGVHYCINAVTGNEGVGEGVLIRALEPLEGITIMARNRNGPNLTNLTNGPGKLCQAFGIDLSLGGVDLTHPPLSINDSDFTDFEIVTAPRVGITKAKDALLRFYIKDNPHVSRR